MLTKEKGYYQKKVETLSKSLTRHESGCGDAQKQLERAQGNFEKYKALVEKQSGRIEELEGKLKEKNARAETASKIKPTVDKSHENRKCEAQAQMIETMLNELEGLKVQIVTLYTALGGHRADFFSGKEMLNEAIFKVQARPTQEAEKSPIKTTARISAQTDESFSSFINFGSLDTLYSQFFKSDSGDSIDAKNRCFKRLYNLFEENITKFHDLFVANTSFKLKIAKFEETF